jgi:hypothetical protein
MSTRSNIAIEDPKTKKVKVIYVHSDGYPYGVGKCLVDHYNMYDLAKELFNHGDASYLGDTIDECSFYGRDWNRDEEPAKTYRDEWMYMYNMRGDCHIEYIYLFKDGQWNVSTSQYVPAEKLKRPYDGGIWYHSKFESVKDNKEYIKYKDKHEKHAEVKMISQIGKALAGAGWENGEVIMQGGSVKKAN